MIFFLLPISLGSTDLIISLSFGSGSASCPHLILNLLLHLVDDLRLELGQQVQDGLLVHALAAHKRVLHAEVSQSINQSIINRLINQSFERKTGYRLLVHALAAHKRVLHPRSVNQSTNQPFKRNWIKASCPRSCSSQTGAAHRGQSINQPINHQSVIQSVI
jgi:hypothetical protein